MSNFYNSLSTFILTLTLFSGMLFCPPISAAPKESSAAKPNKSTTQGLSQKRVHQIYAEGDFDGVIAVIDSFSLANKTYSHADSVFIVKHLAVIYSANPATREKGKHYMFRLLSLLPSAKIVDMFVSDEIDHIFNKVKEEYIVRQQSLGNDTPTQLESNQYAADKLTRQENQSPPAKPIQTKEPEVNAKKRSNSVLYWAAGGATLVAVSGTAFYLMQSEKKPTDDVFVVD